MCLVMQEKENSLNKLFKKKMDFYMHECARFSSHYIAYLSKIAFFVAVFFFATKADWEQFNFLVNPKRTVSSSLCRVSMQLLTITPSCDAVCNKNRQRCDDTKDVCKFTVEKRKKKSFLSQWDLKWRQKWKMTVVLKSFYTCGVAYDIYL